MSSLQKLRRGENRGTVRSRSQAFGSVPPHPRSRPVSLIGAAPLSAGVGSVRGFAFFLGSRCSSTHRSYFFMHPLCSSWCSARPVTAEGRHRRRPDAAELRTPDAPDGSRHTSGLYHERTTALPAPEWPGTSREYSCWTARSADRHGLNLASTSTVSTVWSSPRRFAVLGDVRGPSLNRGGRRPRSHRRAQGIRSRAKTSAGQEETSPMRSQSTARFTATRGASATWGRPRAIRSWESSARPHHLFLVSRVPSLRFTSRAAGASSKFHEIFSPSVSTPSPV